MADFFQQYFIDPIVTQGVAGYNIFNTPVYALGFAIAAFAAYKLLKRLNVKIDRAFLVGILPFILAGGVWRVVRDARIIESPLLVTPLIYFVLFAVTVVSLLASVGIERFLMAAKKVRAGFYKANRRFAYTGELQFTLYSKIWFVLGMIVLLYGFSLLSQLPIQNWNALGIVATLSAGWAIAIFALHKLRSTSITIGSAVQQKFKTSTRKIKVLAVFTRENSGLLWAHMFDASTTFTALQFFATSGYYEQHVVSNVVIGALGPAGQFVLKLVVLIPVLWLLDRELPSKKDAQLRRFLKIGILILGLALGLRNGLRLGLGV
jgi:uncharacterized membrane protein